jgi:hypothetical protein
VGKPFSYPELRARVRALLRRSCGHRREPVIEVGALRIDTVTREVNVGQTPVDVTGMEYALLCHLAGDPRCVFTKHELLRDVWRFRARPHAHSGLPRVPAATEALRPRPRALHRERVGRRVPARLDRPARQHQGRGMTARELERVAREQRRILLAAPGRTCQLAGRAEGQPRAGTTRSLTRGRRTQ